MQYKTGHPIHPISRVSSKDAMTDITQKLPLEILAEILGHASAMDVLRFKQVKRQPLVRR